MLVTDNHLTVSWDQAFYPRRVRLGIRQRFIQSWTDSEQVDEELEVRFKVPTASASSYRTRPLCNDKWLQRRSEHDDSSREHLGNQGRGRV